MNENIKKGILLLICFIAGVVAGISYHSEIKTTVPIEPYKIIYVKQHGKIIKTYYYK